jgi:hypothetical protein
MLFFNAIELSSQALIVSCNFIIVSFCVTLLTYCAIFKLALFIKTELLSTILEKPASSLKF